MGRIMLLTNVSHSMLKYSIIQKHRNELYLNVTTLQLQDMAKKYIFKKHYGDDRTLDVTEMVDNYDPLIY